MKNKSSSNGIKIGDWQFIDEQNLLVNAQQQVTLLPKVMQALEYFIAHPQRVITFDELNQAIWPDEVVGDNSIYNLIGQLRKSLGDSPAKPKYIETISKKGYRLIAPVTTISPENTKPSALEFEFNFNPIKASKSVNKLVAVGFTLFILYLTISNLTQPTEPPSAVQDNPPTSMASEFLALAKHHQFKGGKENKLLAIDYYQKILALAPRHFASQIELAYLNWALMKLIPQERELFYRKALRWRQSAGELQPDSPRLTFLTQLIDQLAEGNIDALAVPFAQLQQSDDGPSISELLAYAQLLFDNGYVPGAIKLLDSAADKCASCADVYLNLAYAHMVEMTLDRAAKAFNRYHELSRYDENNPVKLSAQGALTYDALKAMYQWYKKSATALPMDKPSQLNHLSLLYLNMALFDQANDLTAKRKLANPTAYFTLYTLAAVAGANANFDQSLKYLKQRQQRYPHNLLFSQSLSIAYWMNNEPRAALDILQENVLSKTSEPDNYRLLQATLLKANGQVAEADSLLTTLKIQLTTQQPLTLNEQVTLATVYAQLNDTDNAIATLKAAIENGWVADFNLNWWRLEDNPFLTSLRQLPAFQSLVAEYYATLAAITDKDRQGD